LSTEKTTFLTGNQEIIAARQGHDSRSGHLSGKRFDPESLWQRVDGDLDLLRELAGAFAEEAPRLLAQIENAIRGGCAAELERASHKIKGSLLYLSAPLGAATALDLEEKGRSGSVAGAEQQIRTLKDEVRLVQEELRAMIEGRIERRK